MTRRAALFSALVALLACRGGPSPAPRALELASPAGASSMAPRVSVGGDGEVYLSWIRSGRDSRATLRWSRLAAGRWSPARDAASGEDWFANWADLPGVTGLADGTLLAWWLQTLGEPTYAYGVRYALSADDGASWSRPAWLHEDVAPVEHGFVSVVPDPRGGATLAWLDGRDAGAMRLLARSLHGGAGLGPERLVDDRVCDCCQTGAAVMADGRVVVAYRDRGLDELRDISVAVLDASAASRRLALAQDGWRIAGCPVNGPSVASDGQRVGVAWFTAGGDGRARVRAALSDGDASRLGDPVEIAGPRAGHEPAGRVAAAFEPGGDLAVSFIGDHEGRATVLLRRVAPSGAVSEALPVAPTTRARASGFPQLARAGDALVLAWTEPGDPPRVKTATVR